MINNNLTVFLADDDQDDRSLFLEALVGLPFKTKIKIFDNGVDLMADLLDPNSSLPDILFLDLYMPLMTGEECLQDIRNEPTLVKIPVVIYSGYFDISKINLLRNKGANRFLQKPSSFNELQTLLEQSILSIINPIESESFVIK
ncbi:DNA-binding transcriptional regulator NtrC [Arenibacter antarcticus]|uniref:Response regulator n=1 Tax=Arenibacter antarcticus TaxID=2040469 RepID=A0ABW5VEI2_9FLAO